MSVIESMYLINFGGNASDPNMHLSEQQLVSCVNHVNGYHSRGCTSGLADEAIEYVAENNLTISALYPYMRHTGIWQRHQWRRRRPDCLSPRLQLEGAAE